MTTWGYKDKAASEARLASLERDEERKAAGLVVVDRNAVKKPLLGLIEQYVADLRRQGVSKGHWSIQQGFLVRLARWEKWTVLGHVQHAAMTTALIHLADKGYASKSVNHYRKAWLAFMSWCVDNSLLQENPLARVKPSLGKDRPRKKRAPTMDEWLKLLSVVPLRRRQTYFVAGLTGLRKKELRELEVRDLDFETNRMRLRPEATKAGRADVVPLLPDVLPTLRELCAGLPPTARPIRMPNHRTFTRDLERAGIVSPDETGRFVSFHSLRYFFATLIARALPIQLVKLLMRHQSINTTVKVYVDLGLTDLNEEIVKLPSFLPAQALAHTCRESANGKVMPEKRSGR